VAEYEGHLRAICDPEKTDRQAKDDQNALIGKFGGREKALHTGTPGATPVPGQGHE
jgi:choline-sulfatase